MVESDSRERRGGDERTSSSGESYRGAARRTGEGMSRRGRAALRRAVCGRSLGGRARGSGTGVGCTSKWGGERNHERGEGWAHERDRASGAGRAAVESDPGKHPHFVSFFTARLDLV